ncbi:MAG: inhibitor of KinA [Burkholderiaceae bacterium]|jgi:inhibitor of KinA|tara:strand:+ start:2979 stop:3740 length:762 start_codon:yes stop_codon:yes gene_type:complete
MPAYEQARLLTMGDAALTVELGGDIDVSVNVRCLAVADALDALTCAGELSGVLDVVPTFRSVTVMFNPLLIDADSLGLTMMRLAATAAASLQVSRIWRLPVCFGESYGPDLSAAATTVAMCEDDLITALLAQTLRVYAMGFLPGFAYLAQLPSLLKVPRLASPRTRVPAQSLAIADDMACIYPWESPGGWNLLGCMPVPLFDKQHSQAPALLQVGDQVGFFAVSALELKALQRVVWTRADVQAQFCSEQTDAS